MTSLVYSSAPTPIGTIYLARSEFGICRVAYDLSDDEFEIDVRSRFHLEVRHCPDDPILVDAELQLERYFLRALHAFDVPLDFREGTAFMRRAWSAQSMIPYGQVRSYKWVAEKAGKPRAARAVGQANRRCAISIFVPCHRVISSDGSIGGYGSRADVKEFLLRLEGAQWGKKPVEDVAASWDY